MDIFVIKEENTELHLALINRHILSLIPNKDGSILNKSKKDMEMYLFDEYRLSQNLEVYEEWSPVTRVPLTEHGFY